MLKTENMNLSSLCPFPLWCCCCQVMLLCPQLGHPAATLCLCNWATSRARILPKAQSWFKVFWLWCCAKCKVLSTVKDVIPHASPLALFIPRESSITRKLSACKLSSAMMWEGMNHGPVTYVFKNTTNVKLDISWLKGTSNRVQRSSLAQALRQSFLINATPQLQSSNSKCPAANGFQAW